VAVSGIEKAWEDEGEDRVVVDNLSSPN